MSQLQQSRLRRLGKGGSLVSPIGVGTNKWRQGGNDAAVLQTYRTLLDGGVNFIDTAEVYGFGKSERLIGDCLRQDSRPVIVASKFVALYGRSSRRHLLRALDNTLARLGLKTLDLYYLHRPFPASKLDGIADAMVEAVQAGKIRHVGVSNFDADKLRRFADRLARANVPLAANQVRYSLLHRKPETNGVLDACREIDAALVAYYPLDSSQLTDAGQTKSSTEALRKVLSTTAKAHNASISQVALNWLLSRDERVIPIPGATHSRNAAQNVAALSWTLTPEEFAAIDAASAAWK